MRTRIYVILILLPCSLACLRIFDQNCCSKFDDAANNCYKGQVDVDPLAGKFISIENGWLRDKDGRKLLFRGFNSVRKGVPWYDVDILNETRLGLYKEWGFNVVRLGIMWSGVEPSEGIVNHTYLDIMENITKTLDAHGMYVILDLHQDVASSLYHMYDGFPRWLVKKMVPSRHSYPWPLPAAPSDANWASGYLAEAVGQTFQSLYDNDGGTRDDLSRFWTIVSQLFRSHGNVLGYELMNEPWAGDIYTDPELLLPGNAGRHNLLPLYDILVNVINEYDQSSLIFYEPVTFAVYVNTNVTGTGFDHVPGGPAFTNRSVLAYHHYCWLLNPDDSSKHYPVLERLVCDDILARSVFTNIKDKVEEIGGSSFLTEFGLCTPDEDPDSQGSVECRLIMELADEHFQSWTFWDSSFFDDVGHIQDMVVRYFSRAYPRAVAGKPITMHFNVIDSSFSFQYIIDRAYLGHTDILLPEIHYPGMIDVNIDSTEAAEWKFDKITRIISICIEYQDFDIHVSLTIRPM